MPAPAAAPLTLRRFEPDDLPAVIRVHRLAMIHANAYRGPGPWEEDLERIDEVYLQPGGEFLVGLVDGQIVALGALKRTGPDRAEIKRMRVLPELQGRGYGRQVLNTMERIARERAFRYLHLETSEVQTAAQQLYLTQGYRVVRRTHLAGFRVLEFEKDLAAAEG